MPYVPKVRPESRGLWRPGYWADGWELRHLEWLRWHGLWKLSTEGSRS